LQQFSGSLPSNHCGGIPPDDAADIRERNAAPGGIRRPARCTKVSIRRLLPCFPPAIPAEVWQFVQLMQ